MATFCLDLCFKYQQLVKVIWHKAALLQQMDVQSYLPSHEGTLALPGEHDWFLWPARAHNPNGITIGSADFCTDDRAVSLYFTMSLPFTLKIALPMGYLHPHSIYGSLDPPKSSTQMAFRLVQAFLQGSLVWQTNRQTNRPLDCHIYVHSTCDAA